MKRIASCFILAGLGLPAFSAERILAADPASQSRTISYHGSDIAPVLTEIRYTTIVVLPTGENAVAAACGDTDNWSIEHSGPVVLIKPGKQGIKTNLNIVSSSGNIYSFLLREVSEEQGAQADLRLTINVTDEKMQQALKDKPLFYTAEQMAQSKEDAEASRKALADAEAKRAALAKKDKDDAQSEVESSIRHDYSWKGNKQAADFGLRAIYTLRGFTYFELDHPQEAPAIYEIREGKDSLIQATLEPDGKYCVPKIIEHGYMRVGKSKLTFSKDKETKS